MKNSFIRFLSVASVLVLFLTANVFAIPQKITISGIYQEKDPNTNKINPVQGTRLVEINVYENLTGGVALWTDREKVTFDDNGVFFVELTKFASNPTIKFDKPYFAEIKIGSTVLAPRQPLTSVPYSLNTLKLEGKSLSEVKTEIQQGGGIAGGDAVVKNPKAPQLINIHPLVVNGNTPWPAFASVNMGLGQAGKFSIQNKESTYAALEIENEGKGTGLEVKTNNPNSASPALIVNKLGGGAALQINNSGVGKGLDIRQENSEAQHPALYVINKSTNPSHVAALYVETASGQKAAEFVGNVRIEGNAQAIQPALTVENKGTGMASLFDSNNSNINTPSVQVFQRGKNSPGLHIWTFGGPALILPKTIHNISYSIGDIVRTLEFTQYFTVDSNYNLICASSSAFDKDSCFFMPIKLPNKAQVANLTFYGNKGTYGIFKAYWITKDIKTGTAIETLITENFDSKSVISNSNYLINTEKSYFLKVVFRETTIKYDSKFSGVNLTYEYAQDPSFQ